MKLPHTIPEMLNMLDISGPSDSRWGEVVVRQLLRSWIDDKDELIPRLAAKGVVLDYRCTLQNNKVRGVSVVARGSAIEGELVLGSAERREDESLAVPLRDLAEQVRHQAQLAFL